MKKIPVTEIADGMVLARAVEDKIGRTILRAGEKLSEKFIDRMNSWGVREVFIEIAADQGEAERDVSLSDTEIRLRVDAKLNRIFRQVGGDELMKTIREVSARKLFERARSGDDCL